jgi:hypothetical protein
VLWLCGRRGVCDVDGRGGNWIGADREFALRGNSSKNLRYEMLCNGALRPEHRVLMMGLLYLQEVSELHFHILHTDAPLLADVNDSGKVGQRCCH